MFPKKKWVLTFFLLNFLSKFIDNYRIDTVLSLLVSEILKIPRDKVEAYFLKKLAYVTKKCFAQDAIRKSTRTTEYLSKYTALRE